MTFGAGTIERAYQIARAGNCRTVTQIRDQLVKEGFEGVDTHLSGLGIRNELKALVSNAERDGPA